MSRYHDFDTARAERANEAVRFKIAGKNYELPAKISADDMLSVLEQIEAVERGQYSLARGAFKQLFGEESGAQIMKDVDIFELAAVARWVLQQYGLQTGAAVDDTKLKAVVTGESENGDAAAVNPI